MSETPGTTPASPGRAVYEAYRREILDRNNVREADRKLSRWEGMGPIERAGWEAAAEAGTAAHSLSGTGALMGDIIALRAERDRLAAAFDHTCRRVQAVLDKALGTEDRAGEGIAADVALLAGQRDRLAAALHRLASGDWLGTEGYDSDELTRRREYASDVLKSVSTGERAQPAAPTTPKTSRCTWWSDPSDDFYGMCVKEARHDLEGDPEHENECGIRWTGDRWEQ